MTRPTVRPDDLPDLLAGLYADDPFPTGTLGSARRLVKAEQEGEAPRVRDVEAVLRVLGQLDRLGAAAREHAYWIIDAAQGVPVADPGHVSWAQAARWFGMVRPSQAQHALSRYRAARAGEGASS